MLVFVRGGEAEAGSCPSLVGRRNQLLLEKGWAFSYLAKGRQKKEPKGFLALQLAAEAWRMWLVRGRQFTVIMVSTAWLAAVRSVDGGGSFTT